MTGLVKKTVLGATLAATALTAAAPADAQRYRRYRDNRGGDVATGAIIGGIVGLGLGAAIASSNRNRYYDRGYYDDRRFYDDGRYYDDRRFRRGGGRGYYDRGFNGGGYYGRCRTRLRYDPYYGRRVPVEICR